MEPEDIILDKKRQLLYELIWKLKKPISQSKHKL